MLKREVKKVKRFERKRRIRAKVSGTGECPRISVFRSLKSVSVQAIDDTLGKTVACAKLADLGKNPKNTVESATAIGTLLAEQLQKLDIKRAVFDRSGYRYHGKVKAVAEALRAGSIQI
ncbi:MAG: 50S ribosomal protein L18 [Candidatus Moranbacteria bacterium]|jgi:large subunit ribosomal protein L18|nr:50S ribosomal protein L18 [Candidatus Moranbacteria bacterium]